MKKILTIALSLILTAFIAVGLCACASQPYDTSYVDYGYEISNLVANIKVHDNRKVEVTEEITVSFSAPSRGIMRELLTANGEIYENISVEGEPYFITSDINFIIINTGTNEYLNTFAVKTYVIKYTLIPPKKMFENRDFYMNVLAHGWSTSTSNATVTVSFAHDIDETVLYYGEYGSETSIKGKPSSGAFATENNNITARFIDNKTIEIKCKKLEAYNGVTLDCKLTKRLSAYFNFKLLFACVIAAALALLLVTYLILKQKTELIKPVSFYPPEEDGKKLNPAEMGMLIDNNCQAEDITSLIFYWAHKGNLLIENEGTEEQQKNAKSLTFIKLVDLPDNAPQYEKTLYANMFASGNRVTLKSLENKFFMHITAAQNGVKNKYKDRLYSSKHNKISYGVAALGFLITFLGTLFYGLTLNTSFFYLYGGLALLPVLITFLLMQRLIHSKHKQKPSQIIPKAIGIAVLGAALGIIPIYFIGGVVPLLARIFFVASSCIMGFIAPLFARYTEFYQRILGEILGFKSFLLSAEKSRLEAMLEEDPQYYYNILPYANVLGVSEIWQDKFKALTIQPPAYYRSPSQTMFNIMLFNHIYGRMFMRIKTSTVMRPSRNSSFGGFGGGSFGGGGGFGGGRSGGGFGGGGGGRR